jgi:hypothetical protein
MGRPGVHGDCRWPTGWLVAVYWRTNLTLRQAGAAVGYLACRRAPCGGHLVPAAGGVGGPERDRALQALPVFGERAGRQQANIPSVVATDEALPGNRATAAS